MDKDTCEKSSLNFNEKLILILFFAIVIISQGIRGYINKIIGTSIFNYHLIPISIIMLLFLNKRNRFTKTNIIIFISISSLIFMGYIKNRYGISDLIRVIVGFIAPLIIFLLDYTEIRMNLIFPKIVKSFNVFIFIAFISQAIMSIKIGRTGGIIGHPLTAGWYYGIFIGFNIIYYKYFKSKGDFLILLDVSIALTGTVLAAGRISLFICILLSIVYTFSCCKKRSIPYLILPILMVGFLSTPIVNEYIWAKFKETASWGDVSNGRLLGIREMIFFKKYPNFLFGRGIGYSNYVSQYIFGVVNFENPILMFAYDYGILNLLLIITIIFINPIRLMLRSKNYLVSMIYMCILIIPFTYNGLAETVGIFIVLIFIIYILFGINLYVSVKEEY
ncbi:MAG: hypothetical protein HUJ77_06195 [Clostridium sp.]|uniref:hypothetical protein n=1 Tax=Clostridium sp. TaxID=1506 RepID=UPI0025C2757F|nr:hypothetical protein [Clostridium sp.]MCF0147974.1 hypothetical protein [Clostridium sp.]